MLFAYTSPCQSRGTRWCLNSLRAKALFKWTSTLEVYHRLECPNKAYLFIIGVFRGVDPKTHRSKWRYNSTLEPSLPESPCADGRIVMQVESQQVHQFLPQIMQCLEWTWCQSGLELGTGYFHDICTVRFYQFWNGKVDHDQVGPLPQPFS